MEIRALIFATAAAEGVGSITETLKWGELAYLTSQSKSGSTIRIGWYFDGNRAIVLDESSDLPADSLKVCIAAALTYHRKKKAIKAMG